jgi:hypothetical protein
MYVPRLDGADEYHGMRRLGLSLGVGMLENSRTADRRGEVKTIAIVTHHWWGRDNTKGKFFSRDPAPPTRHTDLRFCKEAKKTWAAAWS